MTAVARREEAIFLGSLEWGTPEDRLAYVDCACAGDPALRARVLELLAAHDKTHGPFDAPPPGLETTFGPSPAGAPMLDAAEGESIHAVKPKSDAMPPPEQTGDRYQLQGEIARGGMGAVLLGRDMDLGRDLAVKVLLEKHANRPEVARRFIEEAQIGGQLQHPGVVPVYDIGRFGDRPFFTMKLVKGQTLAALLKERAAPATDRPRLLGIALQVAQTLAYAHAKGVIHRDLKPSNIMVGAFGEVQVMDWGLAKVLAEGGAADTEKQHQPMEDTLIRTARSSGAAGGSSTETQAGSLLGTPAYMPPEQANGDIAHLDRRSDVFGLGAILCEILTGKPPYIGRSFEEVHRKACNGDLADAQARLAGCGADQELIALTKDCLSPERIDRPKDAQAVAEALTAYLDGVQERLHQAELAEAEAKAKAVEEAKRRRVTLALAGTVLLALTLGGGGWLWVKNERDARQAQVSRDVNDALNKATALREQAKTATVGSGLLFAQAREQAQRALALVANGPADDRLKTQVRELQTELDDEENDRKLVAALDEARLAQTETSADRRSFALDRAVPRFQEAFRAYGLAAGEVEPKVAAERIRQRPPAIREAIVAALDEWEDLAGSPKLKAQLAEPHREWLRTVLEAAEPDDTWGRQVQAVRRETEAVKRQAALEALAKSAEVARLPALALTRLAQRLRPSQAAELLRRAQQHYPADFWVNQRLGDVLKKVTPPQREEAVRFLTAAVALRPESPGAHVNLGTALKENRQFDEAIASDRKAIELDPKLAMAHSNLGGALIEKGQLDEAIVSCRKAIELDPKSAMTHNSLGEALRRKGQLDAAIASCRKALELDPKLALAYTTLGAALSAKGQVVEAIAGYRKALELDPKLALAHCNLGAALGMKDQVDAAIASFRKAIELDPTLAEAHMNLGAALGNKGQLDAAIACWRKALELGMKDPMAYYNLGTGLLQQGQLDEAIANYRKALELDRKFAEVLAHAQSLAAVQGKLAALLKGDFKPTTNDERLSLAELCRIKKLYRTSAGLYADAFAVDPKLADDLQASRRYNAACYAVLGAGGLGQDAATLDDKEKVRLRKQALDWLRANLALWTKLIDKGPPAAAIRQTLQQWQQDNDLAGIRDAVALAKLPTEERAALTQLWADVGALLKKAEKKAIQEQQLAEAGKLAQMGLALLQQKKCAEAEPLIRKSLAIREKMLPDAWTTFNAMSLLGGALLGQKKYADAEPLLVKGYEGMKERATSIPPQGAIRLSEALDRLVQLYLAKGAKDEAARWQKEREPIRTPTKKSEKKAPKEGKP
jgi:eukaryotic-like serine/threonine-protein kinase